MSKNTSPSINSNVSTNIVTVQTMNRHEKKIEYSNEDTSKDNYNIKPIYVKNNNNIMKIDMMKNKLFIKRRNSLYLEDLK